MNSQVEPSFIKKLLTLPKGKPLSPSNTQSSSASRISSFYKNTVLGILNQLSIGQLTVIDGKQTMTFGEADSELVATVRIHNQAAYQKILLSGSIGTAEAYMDGDWEVDSLTTLIQIFSKNLGALDKVDGIFSSIAHFGQKLSYLLNGNSITGAKRNIAEHYDLNNDFFSLFLDQHMMYSAAIYASPTSSLNDAATKKLQAICEKLQLKPSDHLLEIGTGWGGMAIFAAQNYGCKVTTTTISEQQYQYTLEKVKNLKMENSITVLKQDYRQLQGKFDKLVSIEMIEAVGKKYLATYFEQCSKLLKDNGLMLLQAITIPDNRYAYYSKTPDFINTYIFPGGHLPSPGVMQKHISKKTDLSPVHLQDIGLDYAKTLAAWRNTFLQKLSDVRQLGFDQRFIRMWEYYLCYCEGAFLERNISTVQILLAKPDAKPDSHAYTSH